MALYWPYFKICTTWLIKLCYNNTNISSGRLNLFYVYEWPGNVRELRNLVERISILSINENKINIASIVKDSLSQGKIEIGEIDYKDNLSFPLKEAREHFEKDYLISQLKKYKGNISKTAEFVGMERSALHRKLKSLGIKGIN